MWQDYYFLYIWAWTPLIFPDIFAPLSYPCPLQSLMSIPRSISTLSITLYPCYFTSCFLVEILEFKESFCNLPIIHIFIVRHISYEHNILLSVGNVKSSHLYLYSAFNNTNCNKALHNIKIGKMCQCKMTGFNTQLSAECISLLNLAMALSSLVQFIISVQSSR